MTSIFFPAVSVRRKPGAARLHAGRSPFAWRGPHERGGGLVGGVVPQEEGEAQLRNRVLFVPCPMLETHASASM